MYSAVDSHTAWGHAFCPAAASATAHTTAATRPECEHQHSSGRLWSRLLFSFSSSTYLEDEVSAPVYCTHVRACTRRIGLSPTLRHLRATQTNSGVRTGALRRQHHPLDALRARRACHVACARRWTAKLTHECDDEGAASAQRPLTAQPPWWWSWSWWSASSSAAAPAVPSASPSASPSACPVAAADRRRAADPTECAQTGRSPGRTSRGGVQMSAEQGRLVEIDGD